MFIDEMFEDLLINQKKMYADACVEVCNEKLKANSVDGNGISYTPEALKKAVEDFRKECAIRGKQKEAQGAIIINHQTGDLEVMSNVVAASRFGRFIGVVDVGYGNDYSTVLHLAPRGSVEERTIDGDIQSFTIESIDIIKHGKH